jgi:hypothetical protein
MWKVPWLHVKSFVFREVANPHHFRTPLSHFRDHIHANNELPAHNTLKPIWRLITLFPEIHFALSNASRLRAHQRAREATK